MQNEIQSIASRWIGENVPDVHVANAFQLSVKTDVGIFNYASGVEDAKGKVCDQNTVFDTASLTKPIVATAALIAIDRGLVKFDTKISKTFEAFNGDATLLDLLNHSSGLPAWDRFYERYDLNPTQEVSSTYKTEILDEILKAELRPSGEKSVYSDLGYILLGHWLEKLFSKPLDDIIADEIVAPLGLTSMRYVNLGKGDSPLKSVPTEVNKNRTHLNSLHAVTGVVHDENCFIQGGVCGHAGLFSTAADMLTFGEHIRCCLDEELAGIVKPETIGFAISKKATVNDGHYYAGWDMPSGEKTSAGDCFSPEHTFGHLGFTGTSIWIERSKKWVVVLFTNRVFPTRENKKILPFRIAIHNAIGGEIK